MQGFIHGQRISRMKNGAIAILPLVIGFAPFATSTGVFGTDKGFEVWKTVVMSLIVFAGASQVAIMDLLAQAAPLWIIIVTALLINLRFLMYSAVIKSNIPDKASPLQKLFISHVLIDQMFMMVGARVKGTDMTFEMIGAGFLAWLFWHGFVTIGAIFGNIIPPALSIEFSVPVMFLFFGVTMLQSTPKAITAIVTICLIALLYPIMPAGSGLVTAILLGAIAGMAAQRMTKRMSVSV